MCRICVFVCMSATIVATFDVDFRLKGKCRWKFVEMTINSIEFLIWAHTLSRVHTHTHKQALTKCALYSKFHLNSSCIYLSSFDSSSPPLTAPSGCVRFIRLVSLFSHFPTINSNSPRTSNWHTHAHKCASQQPNANKYIKNLNIAFAVDWVDCRFEFKSISVYSCMYMYSWVGAEKSAWQKETVGMLCKTTPPAMAKREKRITWQEHWNCSANSKRAEKVELKIENWNCTAE